MVSNMSFSTSTPDRSALRLSRGTALARNWWALVLHGVVALVFGAVAFLTPVAALGTLVLVTGVYLLADGVFASVAAMRAASHHGRWTTLLLEGVLGVLLGLVAILAPATAVGVFVLLLAMPGSCQVGWRWIISQSRG